MSVTLYYLYPEENTGDPEADRAIAQKQYFKATATQWDDVQSGDAQRRIRSMPPPPLGKSLIYYEGTPTNCN